MSTLVEGEFIYFLIGSSQFCQLFSPSNPDQCKYGFQGAQIVIPLSAAMNQFLLMPDSSTCQTPGTAKFCFFQGVLLSSDYHSNRLI